MARPRKPGTPPQPAPRRARPRPTLSGIANLPARDRAYHDLRYRILTGRLAPGTTLLETELAALLSLSRTPVREATIRLAEERLITIKPRHGITVRPLTLNDVRDILDVLSALEIRAVELVAQRGLTESESDLLYQMLDRMERVTDANDIAQWSDLDDDFHSAIATMCGNERLLGTLDEYWGQQYRPRMMIVPLRPMPTLSNVEHRRIVDALAAGNVEAARESQRLHRERADRQQLNLLRDRMADIGEKS